MPLSDSLTTTTLTPIRDCNFDISPSNNPAFALMLEIRQLLCNARLHLEIINDIILHSHAASVVKIELPSKSMNEISIPSLIKVFEISREKILKLQRAVAVQFFSSREQMHFDFYSFRNNGGNLYFWEILKIYLKFIFELYIFWETFYSLFAPVFSDTSLHRCISQFLE